MPNIPQSEYLSTQSLSRVFTNTTTTYKFYWFLSILKMHAMGRSRMEVEELVIRMVAAAWYPVLYFRLSFGAQDSLKKIITELQWLTGLSMDSSEEEIVGALMARKVDKEVWKLMDVLTRNVPFRFLSPWIPYKGDKDVTARSHAYENGCLYAIQKTRDAFFITLNPVWDKYLTDYYGVLTDFAYWNLTLYLQVRNPNTPNIPNKLFRPVERESLTRQRRFWDSVLDLGGRFRCIYTGAPIMRGGYALDHFLPRSFLAHDQLWNLIPADGSVNSSKSDKLPPLDRFLPVMAREHREAIRLYLRSGRSQNVLDDFTNLGYTPEDLIGLNRERFLEVYQRTFSPLWQIARNMGYEVWNAS